MDSLSSVQNAFTGFTPLSKSSPTPCSNANSAESDALHSLTHKRNSASFVPFVNPRKERDYLGCDGRSDGQFFSQGVNHAVRSFNRLPHYVLLRLLSRREAQQVAVGNQ